MLTGISHEQEDWYGQLLKEIQPTESARPWLSELNDLEGRIVHLTGITKAIQAQDRTADKIAEHVATLSATLLRVEKMVEDAKLVSVRFDPREIQALVASLREFSESPRFRKIAKKPRKSSKRKRAR